MIEVSPADGRRPYHAVDIVVVAGGDDGLDLAVVHGPVFQVEPDAVIPIVGGIADEEGQIMPGGAIRAKCPLRSLARTLLFLTM